MSSWELRDTRLFRDRHHAGQELAKRLLPYTGDDTIILALPRGGVVIGYEIAKILRAPLDVFIARKIGLPSNKEFGIGAIGEGNALILDKRILRLLGLPNETIENTIHQEQQELARRRALYRDNKELPDIKNTIVILVDDGLATGVTAKAAIEGVKKLHPKRIIFSSPICSYEAAEELRHLVDDVLCLAAPLDFTAVGNWYQHFEQVTDEEVVALLKRAKALYNENKNKEPPLKGIAL